MARTSRSQSHETSTRSHGSASHETSTLYRSHETLPGEVFDEETKETRRDSESVMYPSIQEVLPTGPDSDLHGLLSSLDRRFDVLVDVPVQLRALQEVPEQLNDMVFLLGKMETKLEGLKGLAGRYRNGPACEEAFEVMPVDAASELRQIKLPALPSLARNSVLSQASPSDRRSGRTRSWGRETATTQLARSVGSTSPTSRRISAAPTSSYVPRSHKETLAPPSNMGPIVPIWEESQDSLGNSQSFASGYGSEGPAGFNVPQRHSLQSSTKQRHSHFSLASDAPLSSSPSCISTSKVWSLSSTRTNMSSPRTLVRAGTRIGLEPEGVEDPTFRDSKVLAPDSRARLIWDAVLLMNTTLAGAIIPLVLTYYRHRPTPGILSCLQNYIFEFFWLIDVIFNLRTGFFADGELVCDSRKIATRYAQSWLLPDLISILPPAIFEKRSKLYVIVCILKFPRLLQLVPRFSRLRHEAWGGHVPTEVFLVLALLAHLLSCIWRVSIGATDEDECIADAYVKDLYWVWMTLTSVGYGDVVPTSTVSRLFAIFVMLLGSVVFGAVVTACTLLVQKLLNDEAEVRIKELSGFMSRRAVPKELQRRVQHNLRQHFKYHSATAMSPQLLMSLSPAMQRELCLSVLSNTVKMFPLFRNAQRSFVAELAQAHNWEQVLTGDMVADEGHSVQDLVFLVHGSLQAWTPPCYEIGQLDVSIEEWTSNTKRITGISKCLELRAGAWFGEASLFSGQRVYTSLIVATRECELAVLAASKYSGIMQNYPTLWERQQHLERAITAGEILLTDLRHQVTTTEAGDEPKPLKQWNLFGSRGSTLWRTLSFRVKGQDDEHEKEEGEPQPAQVIPC